MPCVARPWTFPRVRTSSAAIVVVRSLPSLAKSRRHIPLLKEEFRARVGEVQPDLPIYRSVEGELETFFEAYSRMKNRTRGEYGRSHNRFYSMAAVLLMFGFMVLPAVNLVNINVSRILERSSEIGVRKAFGASALILVWQFIVENIFLTVIGGFFGLLLSVGVLHLINHSGWMPYAQFHLDIQIFLYSVMIIFIFGVLSGVYPAWKMSRLHPVEALRGGSR